MRNERISRLLRNRFAGDRQRVEIDLNGFMTNPFADMISPAQAALYQAAFLQAQRDVQESEWPQAECWN